MRTWLVWIGVFIVLVLLPSMLGHPARGSAASLFLGACFLVWVGAGALLALRAVVRFLRR